MVKDVSGKKNKIVIWPSSFLVAAGNGSVNISGTGFTIFFIKLLSLLISFSKII